MKKYLSVLVCMALVFSCMLVIMDSQQVLAQEDEELEFTLLAHSSAISFWRPVKNGMEDAAEQLGVKVNFTGPAEMDHGEQVSMIENQISAGVDGIGTTLTSPSAYDDVVQKALDEDIPVIAFNADAEDNPRLAYIGQTPETAGRTMGEKIVELVGEGGEIVFLNEDPGHTDLEARTDGASEVLDENDISYESIDTTTDLSTGVSNVMDHYRGNSDIDGWFGVSATATEAGAQAVEQLDVADEVYAGGFDLTPTTLEAIQDGYAEFTVDQHPYLQGYYTIHSLYLYEKYAIEPVDIDTGGGIIDSSNVDEVLELSEEGYR